MGIRDNDCVQLFYKDEVLYRVGKYGIEQIKIIQVESLPHYVYKDDKGHSYFNHNIIKSCFRTFDEAREEQRRREMITEKRKKLKEYERKLNEEFNIVDHYIVK